AVREELRGVLRKIRRVPPGKPDDFAINQQEELLDRFRKVSSVIATSGFFITGLSLFVGGIGIMNIMFVSVAERTAEISMRMALEALAAHKLRSALTLLGVLVGVFSIILVMTAMRAMKNKIEGELGQLGGQTFIIQRMPGAYFGGPEGFVKFWRRQPITL